MADDFDFAAYVRGRKSEGEAETDRAADYAYEADRRLIQGLSAMKPVKIALDAALKVIKDFRKGDLLGEAVKVSPKQFPRLHAVACNCADKLKIPIPEIFVVQHPILSAYTFGTNEDSYVVLHSAIIDHLDDQELHFVLGHECGHVQNHHVTYHSLGQVIMQISFLPARWALKPAQLALDAWSRRSEITSDRAGLVACESLESAERALVKLALGSQKLYEKIDVTEYLKQLEELRSNIGRFGEFFEQHPYLPKRVEALRLFHGSRPYRKALGDEGGGDEEGLSLAELDEKVSKILEIVG